MSDNYYNEEESILYIKSTGPVSFEDMLAGMKNVDQFSARTKNLRIMEDARKAKANFSITELYQLLQCLEGSIANFTSVRHAVLHHDPTATAFTMMADQNNPTSNYKIKVFTTQKAALHWLKSAE